MAGSDGLGNDTFAECWFALLRAAEPDLNDGAVRRVHGTHRRVMAVFFVSSLATGSAGETSF